MTVFLVLGFLFQPGTSIAAATDSVTIYLLNHGYHVGLFLPVDALPDSLIPERRDFPEATFLEFGWGDADFYPAPSFNLLLGLKALFLPTRSVLHVVGWARTELPPASECSVLRLRLLVANFVQLALFVHRSFRRAGKGPVAPLGPGLYGHSYFYPATGIYSALNTCNTWTARALQAAGCPMHPRFVLTAAALLRAARRCPGARPAKTRNSERWHSIQSPDTEKKALSPAPVPVLK